MKTTNEIKRKIFNERFSQLFKQTKFTQSDFTSELHKRCGVPYSQSTVSHWLKDTLPKEETIKWIAQILDCSMRYLIGETDEVGTYKESHSVDILKGQRAIDSSSLSRYHGKPVWVCFDETTQAGSYALVSDAKPDELLFPNGKTIRIEDCKYSVFANPNPLQALLKMTMGQRMLGFGQAKKMDQEIWVEFLKGDVKARELYSGWYRYDPERKVFYSMDGKILSDSGYGINFVAFEDIV